MPKTFKLTNGHTAQIILEWGNGVVQFAFTNAEGKIIVIRAKRSEWEA